MKNFAKIALGILAYSQLRRDFGTPHYQRKTGTRNGIVIQLIYVPYDFCPWIGKRYLILSPSKNPLSNNTAFDGFALLAKETKGLSKKKVKKFKILKSIGAGDNPEIKNYQKNSSVEIMTGAIVPKPFDSIVPVEKVKYFPFKKKPTPCPVPCE